METRKLANDSAEPALTNKYYKPAIRIRVQNRNVMALFERRTVIFSLAFVFAGLLMVGAMTMTDFHYRLPCNKEAIASESISPDNQWSAAVMERRCWNDSPFIIHVNLRRLGEPVRLGYFSGRVEQGDVFALEHDTADPELLVEWNTSSQLTIRCPGCPATRVKMRKDHWGPITVRYQLSSADSR